MTKRARTTTTSTAGSFAPDARVEPNIQDLDVKLADPYRDCVLQMVASTRLSPAAADMDPREAIEQYMEASAFTLGEQQEFCDFHGLPGVPMRAEDLEVGDAVDLQPIIVEFGDSDIDVEDMLSAQYEMATVEEVGREDGVLVLYTDQGTWGVPSHTRVTARLNFQTGHRCVTCGAAPVIEESLCDSCVESPAVFRGMTS